MANTSRVPLWLAALSGIVIAFTCGVGLSVYLAGDGHGAIPDGVLWPDPPGVAAFNLIADDGQPFTRRDLDGRWTLMFFGFTHCPDVCPTTLDAMARAGAALADHPLYREHGQVVFVSIDPERDGPGVVGEYVHYFDPAMKGVTGGLEELKALTRSVGALFLRVDQVGTGNDNDAGYTMDHSAGVFMISPDAQLVSVVTPPHSAEEIAQRFRSVSAFVTAQR